MPRRSLLTMGAHVLIDLLEQVGTEAAKRRVQLEQQLAQIGKAAGIGRRPGQRRRSSLRGGKCRQNTAAPGETWAGRGAQPRWSNSYLPGGLDPGFVVDAVSVQNCHQNASAVITDF